VSVGPVTMPRAASPLHDRPTFRRLEQIDPYLLLATLLLVAYGVVIAYSTSVEDRTTSDPFGVVARAVVFAALGLGLMAAVAYFDYAWFGAFAPLLYLLTIGLLILVLVIGHNILGGQRWVTIAGQKFQVSEFAKVLMIVVLAKWFADRHDRIRSPLVLLGALVLLVPPWALVYRQPDLGTSLVFVAIFFGMGVHRRRAPLAARDARRGRHRLVPARLVAPPGLSAGAADRVPRSLRRSPGCGLEHHPVAHRDRLRPGDGEGPHRGHPIAARVPADRRVGLRLCRSG